MGVTESILSSTSLSLEEEDEQRRTQSATNNVREQRGKSFKNQPKITGYVIGDAQTGKRSLLCRLRGEDPFIIAKTRNEEEAVFPWRVPHETIEKAIFHVRKVPSMEKKPDKISPNEKKEDEPISFLLFLIHPSHVQSSLKYIEENASIVLKQLYTKNSSRVLLQPSLCFLVNFCDLIIQDDIAKDSLMDQIKVAAANIHKHHAQMYEQYLKNDKLAVSNTSLLSYYYQQQPTKMEPMDSVIIYSSMKNCYGLQALHSFFRLVFTKWKQKEEIVTLLLLQREVNSSALILAKHVQKNTNKEDYILFQQKYQQTFNDKVAMSTDPSILPSTSSLSAKQLQLNRLRQLQQNTLNHHHQQQQQSYSVPTNNNNVSTPTQTPTISTENRESMISPKPSPNDLPTFSSQSAIHLPIAKTIQRPKKKKTIDSAQRQLDLFLGDDGDAEPYTSSSKATTLLTPSRAIKKKLKDDCMSSSEDDEDDFYYDQQGQKKHNTNSIREGNKDYMEESSTKQQLVDSDDQNEEDWDWDDEEDSTLKSLEKNNDASLSNKNLDAEDDKSEESCSVSKP